MYVFDVTWVSSTDTKQALLPYYVTFQLTNNNVIGQTPVCYTIRMISEKYLMNKSDIKLS